MTLFSEYAKNVETFAGICEHVTYIWLCPAINRRCEFGMCGHPQSGFIPARLDADDNKTGGAGSLLSRPRLVKLALNMSLHS